MPVYARCHEKSLLGCTSSLTRDGQGKVNAGRLRVVIGVRSTRAQPPVKVTQLLCGSRYSLKRSDRSVHMIHHPAFSVPGYTCGEDKCRRQ